MKDVAKFFKSLWPIRILLVSLITVEALGGLGLLSFQTEFTWKGLILQSAVTLIAFELINYFSKKKKIDYAVGVGAFIFAIPVTADAIGDMAHLYGQYIAYDQWMHLLGGFGAVFVVTGFIFAVYNSRRRFSLSKFELFLYGLSVGMLGSVIYELEEYLEDLFTGSNRLGDGFDTANDLGLGLLGGVLAALLVVKFPRLVINGRIKKHAKNTIKR